jgi:hypothetical protein
VADRRVAGRVRVEGLARAGPGHLGGRGQAAALRLLEAHGLGRARPRASSARSAAIPRRRQVECDGRGDPRDILEHGVSERGVLRSTTRPTRSTPRCSSRRSSASSPAATGAAHRRSTDREELTRERLRAPLPHRRDRRRAVRQGRHVPHLLVLARVGARDHRRAAAGARP